MSRMIYRKSQKAYESDYIGYKLAKEFMDNGEWEKAKFMDQHFILLPFEHQENPSWVEKWIGRHRSEYI